MVASFFIYLFIFDVLFDLYTSDEFEFENGTIEVDQGSNFNATDESEFSFSIITFYITPYLGDVEFESVNIQFYFSCFCLLFDFGEMQVFHMDSTLRVSS